MKCGFPVKYDGDAGTSRMCFFEIFSGLPSSGNWICGAAIAEAREDFVKDFEDAQGKN